MRSWWFIQFCGRILLLWLSYIVSWHRTTMTTALSTVRSVHTVHIILIYANQTMNSNNHYVQFSVSGGCSTILQCTAEFWHDKKDGYRQQNVHKWQILISIIDYDVCILEYLQPFWRYSTSKNGLTLKSGYGVLQGHWKRRGSIEHVWLSISPPL